MADTSGTGKQQGTEAPVDKGKGKAVQQPQDTEMEEDDDSSSEEENEIEQGAAEEEDEDNMEEISLANVVGPRTRGKQVDYQKAAQELPEEDDDEEDDEDFVEDEEMAD